MKVFTMVDGWLGYVFHRIDKALHDWAPADIEWVETPQEADVQIVHIIGKGELKNIQNKNYVVIQYCYHTQDIPPTDDGLRPLWENAVLVSSFHDFKEYHSNWDFDFFGMPLGADDSVFFHLGEKLRAKEILTTGYVAGTESLEEVFGACQSSGFKMVHLGRDFGWSQETFRHNDWVPDDELCKLYNSVSYTGCLRRVEGFEAPAIEGLMCGARPITFDLSTYRWYHKYAVVIKDTNPKDIQEKLAYILTNRIRLPVTKEEIEEVKQKFSWSVLIPEFWNKIKEAMDRNG